MRTHLRRLVHGRRASTVAVVTCTVALAATLTACGAKDDALRTPEGSLISTTTTRFAEVNIVNAGRDYTRTCLAPTETDPGRADVKRIIVTDPALLDALCALGLNTQVQAILAEPGSVPTYLGPQLAAVPTLGVSPTADKIRPIRPDLVLTSPATVNRLDALRGSGALGSARVETIDPKTDNADGNWQQTFTAVSSATNRSKAGATRLAEFTAEATRAGRVMDAQHTQVSLVRFTPDGTLIEGTSSFGAQVLAALGAGRPAAQRVPDAVPMTDKNMTDADADLILVTYVGDEGRARGKDVLLSDEWLDMGAPTWKRVQSVDDNVWYTQPGLASAWLVLNDLKNSLNSSSSAG